MAGPGLSGRAVANSVATGDFDADGDLDIVLSRARGLDDLVLFNDGSGAFSSVPLPDSQGESMTPTVADFDNDGDLDLFLGGFVPWPPLYDFALAAAARLLKCDPKGDDGAAQAEEREHRRAPRPSLSRG